MENNARLPKKYRKVGYNYLSLKGDNVDNLFSLPPNDLKTILCLINDYVNSLDLRRSVLSASDGLRSYKKAFETRKYRVVFTVSPTAMSGLILTYNHHYLLKNSNNKVSYNQLRFNTESKEIESKDYYNPLGIPYDTPTRKYFVGDDKDKMLDYCNKHNGIWGSNKNPYGDLYYYVDISKK